MQDIVVTPWVVIPGGELAIAFARSGGPGGQNVNKVASKVELRWNPTTSAALSADDRAWLVERLRSRLTGDGTLIVTSTATRDQLKNRDDATGKLALIVRAALVRPKPRHATRPSRAATRRRVADKRHHAEIKRNRRASDAVARARGPICFLPLGLARRCGEYFGPASCEGSGSPSSLWPHAGSTGSRSPSIPRRSAMPSAGSCSAAAR